MHVIQGYTTVGNSIGFVQPMTVSIVDRISKSELNPSLKTYSCCCLAGFIYAFELNMMTVDDVYENGYLKYCIVLAFSPRYISSGLYLPIAGCMYQLLLQKKEPRKGKPLPPELHFSILVSDLKLALTFREAASKINSWTLSQLSFVWALPCCMHFVLLHFVLLHFVHSKRVIRLNKR